MRIITERLSIKPYSQKDMAALIELLKDDTIKETFIIPDLHEQDQYEKMFNKMKRDTESIQHYAGGIYLNDILIGFILDTDVANSTVEIGYVILPSYQNCGYATEALNGVIKYLFQNGINEVIAGAFSNNLSSIRIMIKNGMKLIDRREDIEYRGKIRHCVFYSIKKENA